MELLLCILILLLLAVILTFSIKLRLIRKSAGEIKTALAERTSPEADTNTLICISSGDKSMRRLASAVNVQLRLLRGERRRFLHGDLELKEAIANISHDLRTPLTAIHGYLELLEQEAMSDAARHDLDMLRGRCRELEQLTEELFQYSVAVSVQQLHPGRLDLNRALEECLLAYRDTLERRQITPDISLPRRRIYRLLDPGALHRILENLLANAVKYSDGDLSVTLSEDGVICFSNTARGLDAVSAGRLFDRFYTVENGRNSTGLGLSIARLLTQRMDGTIRAKYADSRLSIIVCFPAEETAEKEDTLPLTRL